MLRRSRNNNLSNNRENNSNNLSHYENSNQNPISYLHQKIDNMFNEIISSFGGVSNLDSFFDKRMPNIDIKERPNEYILNANLPGMDSNDIKLEIINNTLHLIAGKKDNKENKDGYISSVCYMEKSFTLPHDIEENKIEAEMKNGVLKIIIPRNKTTPSRRININKR